MALADDERLYFLDFITEKPLPQMAKRLAGLTMASKNSALMTQLKNELHEYFLGNRRVFQVPIHLVASPFQQAVWQSLHQTAYGETRSYKEQAQAIEHPKACRAVANAHAQNPVVILIPCHRTIGHTGSMGGYRGEIWRKQWLIAHEAQHQDESK